MDLTPRLQKRILAGAVLVLAVVYGIAWLAPAIGLYHDDAIYLVTARALLAGHGYTIDSLPAPIPQTKYPPLFPGLLAVFALVAENAQWLKLVPLLCTAAWLWLTARLLRKMGASRGASWLLVGMTAAAPATVFLSSNLLSETLFAALLTAALILLLEERTISGGLCAGLAMLTRTAGLPLIAACVLTLLLRKRLKGAAQFTAAAALVVLPWLVWSALHQTQDLYYSGANYSAQNVLTGLDASEKVAVMSSNFMFLLASPFALLTGMSNVWTAVGTLLLVPWCLYRRRQLVPDLFIFLYLVMLDLWAWPPQRFVAPVLPLILWMVWRAARMVKNRDMVAACVVILGGLTLYATARQLPVTLRNGQFPSSNQPPNNWAEMQKMFAWVRANTLKDAVIVANLDPLWYLNTGRRALRGFTPNPYRTFYQSGATPVTPAELAATLLRSPAAYVALSPDLDFAESASYHKAVEALQRGGLLEPVEGTGLGQGYRLYRATGAAALR